VLSEKKFLTEHTEFTERGLYMKESKKQETRESEMDGETVLPEGWVETNFDSILISIRNGISEQQNKSGIGIPVTRIESISEGVLNTERIGYVENFPENKKAQYELKKGDILFSHINSPIHLGKTAIINILEFKLYHGTNLLLLRTVPFDYLANYFELYCRFFREKGGFSKEAQHAVNQSSLNQKKIKNFPLPLPPLNEQKRIVAKLDSIMPRIDSVKERLEKIPVILKRFRQSVLTAAVTGKLTEKWREEHPDVESAEVLLERIREERLKRYEKECEEAKKKGERKPNKLPSNINYRDFDIDLPEKWIGTSPEHLASPDKYALAIGPFGSNLKVSDYVENGVPIVFVKNIKSENFLKDRKYVSKEKAAELSQHIVKSGDLLITKMGTPPGDCCIYHDLEDAIITSDCLKFSTWNEFVESKFYKVVINSNIVRRQLIEITQGVAQQKISLERFKSITLPLPPLEEQKEIVRQVDKLFALADKVEDHYKKAKLRVDKLSQSVLAKAFRGELVPQDPNDEPAEKLLERILEEKKRLEDNVKLPSASGKKKIVKKKFGK
jgi:type I restriction enzyme S subunit